MTALIFQFGYYYCFGERGGKEPSNLTEHNIYPAAGIITVITWGAG